MIIIDPITKCIVNANTAACDFYGYSKEVLTSMKLTDINIEPLDEIERGIQEIKEKGYKHMIFKHRLFNGDIKDVEIYSSLFETKGRAYFHSIIHDISEKKATENKLIITENKYKKLFNNLNDIVFLVKIEENDMPGNFLDINDVFCKELGYTRKELLRMTVKDISQGVSLMGIINRTKDMIQNQYHKFDWFFSKKDGTLVPVEISAHQFELSGGRVSLCVCRNISKQRAAKVALEKSEERYRTLVESSPDPIFVHTSEKFLFLNSKAAKLLGADRPEDIIGRSIWDFCPDEYIDLSKERFMSVNNKLNAPLSEQRIINLKGSIIDVEVSTSLIPYGNVTAILNILRDITERKAILADLNNTLEENKYLLEKTIEYDNLKTEFISNISHELKTPLNIIFSTMQLFSSNINVCNCEQEESIQKHIRITKQNCYRLLRLINNLIDITKLENDFLRMNFKNYNIVSIVEDITQSVAEYIKNKEINLVFDTDTEEKLIACDADKIERIMLNLLSNSVKFTKPKGTIWVNMFDWNDRVVISVKDTGIGIPKDKLSVIFDRFRQAESLMTRMNEGSGIGLSLVQALVKAHGGTIDVTSEVGKGSEFIIEIPVRLIDHSSMVHEQSFSLEEEKVERIYIEFSDIYSE